MPLVDIVCRIVWLSVASAGHALLRAGYAVAHMDTAVPNSNHFASRAVDIEQDGTPSTAGESIAVPHHVAIAIGSGAA
jgi:hypothetical protein